MQLKSVFKVMILFMLKNKKKHVSKYKIGQHAEWKWRNLKTLHAYILFNARVIIALRRIKKMYSSSCQQRDCFQTTCLIDMSVYIRDIKSGAQKKLEEEKIFQKSKCSTLPFQTFKLCQ